MKKILKVTAGSLLVIVVLFIAIAKLTGNGYLIKGLWAAYLHGANSATIDDARFFKTNAIAKGDTVWQWPVSADYNKNKLSEKSLGILTKTQSVAFVVIKNDSILYEQYWDGYSDSSQSNSFSMAKSITTMLAQIAIQKGFLKGWNQKVNSILPELKGPHAAEVDLKNLSTMSSGLLWDEEYKDPFCITAKSYYGDDENKLMLTLPITDTPGKFYNYQSGSTQLLGMCVMKATGKSLSQLASEWLWKPMQANHDAKWHTDDKGTELCYCCFNTDARDFARFGKLMLHQGNWNGNQLIDSSFVNLATKPAYAPFYGYSFWLYQVNGTKVFYQRGLLGQYIITIPDYNLVVVRLGRHTIPPDSDDPTEDFKAIVDEAIAMSKK